MITLEDIKKMGSKKYSENRGVYRNPYPMGTPEFNEFERGWMQYLKREGAHLVNTGERNALVQSAMTRTLSTINDIAVERYRSSKG